MYEVCHQVQTLAAIAADARENQRDEAFGCRQTSNARRALVVHRGQA
jgi:hypothetical protein